MGGQGVTVAKSEVILDADILVLRGCLNQSQHPQELVDDFAHFHLAVDTSKGELGQKPEFPKRIQ